MQLKKTTQSVEDQLKDRVYAAMETGNHSQARTLMKEIGEHSHTLQRTLYGAILREYGVVL